MDILFLTQIIPYPLDAGPKIKTWNVLRYLSSQGHHITLASFVRKEEAPYVEALRQVCSDIHTIPIQRSRPADGLYWLRSQLTGRPFLIERDDLAGMRKLVQDLLAARPMDCIQADQLTMAQFALSPVSKQAGRQGKKPIRIFDAHNAVWTIADRLCRTVPWYVRPFVRQEARRIKAYEGMLVDQFDHILAVTELDHKDLLDAWRYYLLDRKISNSSHPASITVAPIAIDTRDLKPINRQPGSLEILTLGSLHYPPNADGIRWFIQEVFPLVKNSIPEVKLTIIGKKPPQDFLTLASEDPETFTVTGYVPELRPYLEKAGAVVIPVRVGSGMRVRILEALAQGLPVVTTTIGLEGINASPGRDILVGDSPEEFSKELTRLILQPELQKSLAENGRQLVERCYDWQIVLKTMDQIYSV
jgi:glycosyltransferase involved in cell wall biosynthesis